MSSDTRRETPTDGRPAEDRSQPAPGTAQYPDQPEGGATRR
jgi:hypothetical protein